LNELLGLDEPFEPQWIVKGKFMKMCLSLEKNRNWKDAQISEEAKDLIKKLMRVTPEARLGAKGFEEIKNHPFFKSIDWNKLMNLQVESPLKNLVKKHPVKAKIVRETHIKDDDDFPQI
jgi:serine/threonine protein kinase